MRFLLWEINYVGLGTFPVLSRFNKKLINEAVKEGLNSPPPHGGTFNRIAPVKHIRQATGSSVKDAYEFCKKYVYPEIERQQ